MGRQPNPIICSATIEEMPKKDLVLVDVICSIPHRTYISKKYMASKPEKYKIITK